MKVVTMDNIELAETLETIGTLQELNGANTFKVRAYKNAARTVHSSTEDLVKLSKEDKLGGLKGIGSSIAGLIKELVDTGDAKVYKDLLEKTPEGLMDILRLPGIGPKKVRALWQELEIKSLAELAYACNENRLIELKGFGKKTQVKILDGIKHLSATKGRHLFPFAKSIAEDLVKFLEAMPQTARVEVAGSLRRGRETVKDLDLLVESSDPGPIMEAVSTMPIVDEIIGSGETKTSVRLKSGIAVDVRVVESPAFPFALMYFTGSKEHNIEMRRIAREKGYSLNEYDFTPLEGVTPALPEFKEEADVFAFLGLEWIDPTMRENVGEIEVADKKGGKLPTLVKDDDIRGVLHIHTVASDGNATVEQLCEESVALGYEYIGISDHSKAAFYANGLDEGRVKEQQDTIAKAQAKFPGLKIFHGIEADILPSGDIDLDDDCLESLDFVIASVHSSLNMNREDMTKRLLKAIAHPAVKVLGHPTGRILLGRKGYSFDWDAILDAAKEHKVAIECNANPHRLDADWIHIRRARERGVKICINPDAHAVGGLSDTRYGVLTARRGWAEKHDVVNTLSAEAFEKEFLQQV
jgi:DNA polymerase (family X)